MAFPAQRLHHTQAADGDPPATGALRRQTAGRSHQDGEALGGGEGAAQVPGAGRRPDAAR